MNKNITNESQFMGDVNGDIFGNLTGNVITDYIFEETVDNGINIDGVIIKDDTLYPNSGNLKIRQNPSNGPQIYLTPLCEMFRKILSFGVNFDNLQN